MNEQQLTAHLIDALQADFDIRREVKGYNLLTRGPIRADVVAHPKPHFVAAGFVDAHFCIEADMRICFGAGRYWSKRLGISAVKNLGLRLHVGTR